MNKKIILFLALLLFPLILRASAVERVPGVEVGDYFLYDDIVVYWSSTDPNATLPEEFKEFNETEWMYMSVVDVVDTLQEWN